MDEKNFKAEALGVVSQEKIKIGNKQTVSLERLRQPLSEEAGLYTFCTTCGSYHQIKKIHIQELEEALEKKIPASEYYYEVSSCILCDNPERNAELKKIADLK